MELEVGEALVEERIGWEDECYLVRWIFHWKLRSYWASVLSA